MRGPVIHAPGNGRMDWFTGGADSRHPDAGPLAAGGGLRRRLESDGVELAGRSRPYDGNAPHLPGSGDADTPCRPAAGRPRRADDRPGERRHHRRQRRSGPGGHDDRHLRRADRLDYSGTVRVVRGRRRGRGPRSRRRLGASGVLEHARASQRDVPGQPRPCRRTDAVQGHPRWAELDRRAAPRLHQRALGGRGGLHRRRLAAGVRPWFLPRSAGLRQRRAGESDRGASRIRRGRRRRRGGDPQGGAEARPEGRQGDQAVQRRDAARRTGDGGPDGATAWVFTSPRTSANRERLPRSRPGWTVSSTATG